MHPRGLGFFLVQGRGEGDLSFLFLFWVRGRGLVNVFFSFLGPLKNSKFSISLACAKFDFIFNESGVLHEICIMSSCFAIASHF